MGEFCGEDVECLQGFDGTSYKKRELGRTKCR